MEYKYKAFISYRHREIDKYVALRLQKLLEGFKMKGRESWKLFRDESELPTSSSLSDDIDRALNSSEYLIVICTPALKESKWCMQEIATFKKLHNGSTDKILPILVEGDPEEAFPDLLKTSRKQVLDPVTGEKIYQEIEIEPLAANVCGFDKKEINRKLKVEYLRLAAPMSGVGFDDLYNRKRRQQIKRILLASTGIVAATLAFGIYNFSMNLKLEEKNQQISEQLLKTKIANAEALNGQAEALYDNGHIRDAIETLLEAYEMNNDNTALVPSSDKLLASEIGAYSVETTLPHVRISHLIDVKDYYFRNDGHRLVSIDNNENIYLWNADNGKLVRKWKQKISGQGRINCLITESHSVQSEMKTKYLFNNTISGYDSNIAGMVLYGFRPENENLEIPLEDDETFILYNRENLWIVNAESGEELSVSIEDVAGSNFHFADWGGSLVAISPTQEEDNVLVISQKDASVIRKMTISLENIGPINVLTDNFVISSSLVGKNLTGYRDKNISDDTDKDIIFENEDMSGVMGIKMYQSGPYIIDIEQGTTGNDTIDYDTIRFVVYDKAGVKKWTFSDMLYSTKIRDAKYIPAKENKIGKDLLLFVYGNRTKVCDASSGKVLEERSYDGEVLDYRVGSSGMVEVTIENGQIIRHMIGDSFKKLVMDTKSKPKQMKVCANKAAVITSSGSKNIDIYTRMENEDAKHLGTAKEITGDEDASVSSVVISKDGKNIYYKNYDTNEIFTYSVENKKKDLLYVADYYIYNIYELKNAICIGGSNTITLVDKTNGSILVDHLEVDKYFYIPEKQELVYYLPSLSQSSYTPVNEIIFTDGDEEYKYGLGENSTDDLDMCYFSEDGSRFALVYKELAIDNEEAREYNKILLCDRNSDAAPRMAELEYEEPCVCNIRFSADNQLCMISLNIQKMQVNDEITPGVLEGIDFESGKNIFTHKTEKGLIVNEYMHGQNIFLLCSDYTLEIVGNDGTLKKSINLDEDDIYSDMTDYDTGSEFVSLNDTELLLYSNLKGFVVDTEKEALRMVVDDNENKGKICGFIEDEHRIVIATPWQVSSYPIYSSNELYKKAKK